MELERLGSYLMTKDTVAQLHPKVMLVAALLGLLLAFPIIFDAWKQAHLCAKQISDSMPKPANCSN